MLSRWLMVAALRLLVVSGETSLPSSQFKTLPYSTIQADLEELAANYPHLAKVYSAQERYQLPSPGSCSADGSVRCEQWVLHVSDHASLEADPERPEVFFSGCLHGDEQVGPTAVLEAAKLMVYAAVCHADSTAKECHDFALANAPESVPWLARLALSRSTVFIPMTNPIGYYNTVRGENGLDPNRDFPYQQKPSKCMTTITARAVNEVWREHVFQLAVTFHGGMVAMAYEWGSPNHPHKKDSDGAWKDISPDHGAQKQVATGLSRFAGSFEADGETFQQYPAGRMNKLVYPVAGGMEDWAYAGSWDTGVAVCTPEENGGYPKEKTIYESATLRALNILVEASDKKHPPQSLLGSRQGLLDRVPSTEKHANGHVARNIRLILMVVDLVQPYVQWGPLPILTNETASILQDPSSRPSVSVLPSLEPGSEARVVYADKAGHVDLQWTVGGAFQVDATQLIWGVWPENSEHLSRDDWYDLVSSSPAACRTPPEQGASRWGEESSEGATTFEGRFEFENMVGLGGSDGPEGWVPGNEAAFVVAVAEVDQSWAKETEKVSPDVGPQSHFVNARTSEDWFQKSAGHIVRGRVRWLSAPLKVERAHSNVGSKSDKNDAQTADEGGEVGATREDGHFPVMDPPLQSVMPSNVTGSLEHVERKRQKVEIWRKVLVTMSAALLLAFAGLLALRWVVVGRTGTRWRAVPASAWWRRFKDRRREKDLAMGGFGLSGSTFGGRSSPDVSRRRTLEGGGRGGGAMERQGFLSPISEAP